MFTQLAQNNYNYAGQTQGMNAPAPTYQPDHLTYTMMLGQSCNSSVNVDTPTCRVGCGIDDVSGQCNTSLLFDSAVYGYAQSLLAQDQENTNAWEALYTYANLALEAEIAKDVAIYTLGSSTDCNSSAYVDPQGCLIDCGNKTSTGDCTALYQMAV